jgi:hypothetical protein
MRDVTVVATKKRTNVHKLTNVHIWTNVRTFVHKLTFVRFFGKPTLLAFEIPFLGLRVIVPVQLGVRCELHL